MSTPSEETQLVWMEDNGVFKAEGFGFRYEYWRHEFEPGLWRGTLWMPQNWEISFEHFNSGSPDYFRSRFGHHHAAIRSALLQREELLREMVKALAQARKWMSERRVRRGSDFTGLSEAKSEVATVLARASSLIGENKP